MTHVHVVAVRNIRSVAVHNKRTILFLLAAIVILLGLQISCSQDYLILPGQSSPASNKLVTIVEQMEKLVGKPIEFDDISTNPDKAVATGIVAEGTYGIESSRIRIWLNANLSPSEIEFVAAHELGHIYQHIEGWASAGSLRNQNGEPLYPQISMLGSYIGSLVADPNANKWAADRGFSIEEYFKSRVLPGILNGYFQDIKSNDQARNWDKFYDSLNGLSEIAGDSVKTNKQIVIQDREYITLGLAITYAHLKLCYGQYSSFSEIESLFEKKAPYSKLLGLKVAQEVARTGYDNKEQNENALAAVLDYLKIPSSLLWVRDPSSGEVIWPKK